MIKSSAAPPFEKFNQHYVPQFWQRGFADAKGHVWARYRREADPVRLCHPDQAGLPRKIGTKNTMTGDFTYTVFDFYWRPSDALGAC
jgi:hypothetical protein